MTIKSIKKVSSIHTKFGTNSNKHDKIFRKVQSKCVSKQPYIDIQVDLLRIQGKIILRYNNVSSVQTHFGKIKKKLLKII